MEDGRRTGASLRVSTKAAREDTRRTNRRLVLQHLFDGQMLSRADLSRQTGLTSATISTLVGDLQGRGLIVEAKSVATSRGVGKPPTMLQLKADARNVVAVDISDPLTLRVGLVDLAGAVVARVNLSIDGRTGDDLADFIEEAIRQAITQAKSPLLGIGIATPGIVEADGTVAESIFLQWRSLPLATRIGDSIGLATYVCNDANAAAIAEYSRGDHDSDHIGVIRIGSGIGAGFILHGRPFVGQHFGAGEIGHLIVDASGPLCRCGHRGCLELYSALPGIKAALAKDNADAEEVLANAGERLGIALASIVSILDVGHILICGPEEFLGEGFCAQATKSLRARCLENVAEAVRVSYSSLGEDVVMLGAAALVLSKELGVA